jgi:hypothetical protein
MRNIVNALCMFLLCPAVIFSQQETGGKCMTSDRYLRTLAPGINGKVTFSGTRPDNQVSVLSPSKRFRIHYDTSGANVPAMVTATGERITGSAFQFVDTVGKIFDSVWTAEITTFGFAAPPSDNGVGGGDEFDVYIQDLGANSFGYTDWDDSSPLPGSGAAPRYPSFVVIDNDYGTGFRTIGIHALMSTAAHEFHHAIQVSGYGVWGNDFYFYELTAEAMEPTVFPSSKDYVNDIGIYFSNIQNIALYSPQSISRGYERAIWSVFLMKRYGVSIMREIWESISSMRPIPAMAAVLAKNGTSLPKEFSEFCYWNYFTGARADSVRFYTDAKLFPQVSIRDRETLGNIPVLYQYTCKGFGVNYLQAIHAMDTAAFIIANTNMDDALGPQSNSYGYQFRASLSSMDGGSRLANGWWTSFSVTDPTNWLYSLVLSNATTPGTAVITYPNPYRPDASLLYIGPIAAGQEAPQLSIISASYDGIYAGNVPVRSFNGSLYAVWDGRTSRGEMAASGIYVYVLSTGGTVVQGKFAVIR